MKLTKSQSRYIKVVYELSSGCDDGVRICDVAEKLNVSKASASLALTKLAEQGLIYKDTDRHAHLTESGERKAIQLRNYIDYAAYGRDVALEESGHFTGDGYVLYTGGFTEVYSGREDIPDEHRIFAYPELNIRERMAAYKDVIDRSADKAERGRSTVNHEER